MNIAPARQDLRIRWIMGLPDLTAYNASARSAAAAQSEGASPVHYEMELRAMIPNPPTIGKIGFFQFGDSNKSEPVNSLASELDKAASTYQGLTNSLIVLPEALNILNDYMTPSDPDPSVARGLKEISLRLGVVFVAGLVIEGRKGQCYSCGCLIDGDMCRILSCKTDDDRSHNRITISHTHVSSTSRPCTGASVSRPWFATTQLRTRLTGTCRRESGDTRHWLTKLRHGDRAPQRFSAIVANGTPKHPNVVRFGGPPMCSEKDENAVRLYSSAELEPKH